MKAARPSLGSQTTVRLAPLGTIVLDTHDWPMALELLHGDDTRAAGSHLACGQEYADVVHVNRAQRQARLAGEMDDVASQHRGDERRHVSRNKEQPDGVQDQREKGRVSRAAQRPPRQARREVIPARVAVAALAALALLDIAARADPWITQRWQAIANIVMTRTARVVDPNGWIRLERPIKIL